jgi:Tol biopolymer transport system component
MLSLMRFVGMVAVVAVSAIVLVPAAGGLPSTSVLAYVEEQGGIYLLDSSGTGVRELPRSGAALDVAWSPDGGWLAFTNSPTVSSSDLWKIRADGTGLQRLTHDGNSYAPVWSRDGRRIYYTHGGTVKRSGAVWVMNADGSDQKKLARRHSPVGAWSPDGRYVAVTRRDPEHRWQIYVVRRDGSHRRQVTHNQLSFKVTGWSQPAWSPDGTTLAYTVNDFRNKNLTCEVELVQADGDDPRSLAECDPLSFGAAPAWSPDGHVTFAQAGASPDTDEIMLIEPNGSGLTPFHYTNVPVDGMQWQPAH